MSEQRTLQARKGNTFGFDMRMKNPDGTPINLTGHAMELVIGLGGGDTFRKDFTIDNAAAGQLSIHLSVEEVDAFEVRRHPFEIIHTAAGEVRTIVIGYFLVTQWVGADA